MLESNFLKVIGLGQFLGNSFVCTNLDSNHVINIRIAKCALVDQCLCVLNLSDFREYLLFCVNSIAIKAFSSDINTYYIFNQVIDFNFITFEGSRSKLCMTILEIIFGGF